MSDSARPKIRVALATLGCKVNQYESASFASSFEERGAELVDFGGPADVSVVNTCAVTARAGAQSRNLIRRALRANPEGRLVVTGCYSQIAAGQIVELSERPICIVGNGHKDKLVEIALAGKSCDLEMYLGDIGRKREICRLPVRRFADRTRAFLRVQDGCNRFCTYCIVPYARGRSRSLPPAELLAQAEVFAREGYREAVITGIHVGHYGQDLAPPLVFADLLKLLAGREDGLRYRISSLEPLEVTAEVLALVAGSGAFMPHLHIPLQSGDDAILRKMNRPYTRETFAEIVQACRAALPEAAIGVDVLAGFPGEDERAFGQTVELLERLPVTYLHVFPYSRRPGTVAAGFPGQVPEPVKEERVAVLRALDRKKRAGFYASQLGQVRPTLIEGRRTRANLRRGFTDNYVPVVCRAPESAVNQVLPVRLTELTADGVLGTVES
ncbi:MAG: tRNA (N(6)-L-threonylcarbamoyladenosine(37)-C(2))-methylthiotransferase MtaB [Desulfobacteraceae bacterium]|nr:tRNA (N(6)-L-threonylcarbamoyladenosine(37)-C(2))-methylthiotransferase MtaB [Desulfobacteraceae bacterium]